MSDHDVELGAAAAVRVVVAAGADHAVAVHEPRSAVAPRRARRESRRRNRSAAHTCPDPAARRTAARRRCGRTPPVSVFLPAPSGFFWSSRPDRPTARRSCPASGLIARPSKYLLARERADVGDVTRRELRRQLDHDAAARELQVQRVLGIERAPVGRLGRGQHVGHGLARRCGRRIDHERGCGQHEPGALEFFSWGRTLNEPGPGVQWRTGSESG